ncbi:hypothetical protein ACJIZ3_024156 [Penstemon smallii]|uniref:Uncharacterized protein n=1 Tax=Penstemon smallii TaxID=265156 RepID=A0ABD3TS25_9LAMI
MEVCVPFNTSSGQDSSSNSGSPTDPLNQALYSSKELSGDDLGTCLTQHLNIEDSEISTRGCNLSPKKNDMVSVVREDGHKYSDQSKFSNSASEKCFSKCASFPPLDEPKSSVNGSLRGKKKQKKDKAAEASEVIDNAKYINQCYSGSVSLPTPLKLVSAMKGGREKQGKETKKLSVTWAPDVYDPIPTSVSHVPSNKNQVRYGKKYGKNKQKNGGKSSRGKSKDKKQPKKNSGSTNNKLKPMHNDSGTGAFRDPEADIADYNVGSPDPFCGSSFLKKSVENLHFPVAEAT